MITERFKSIAAGLRFRLTLSYALFFVLLLGGVGVTFRAFLDASQTASLRDNINQEWAAMKGFLQIHNGMPEWFYDREDPEESFIVARLQQVYLLTDRQGSVLQVSDLYSTLAGDTPDEVRTVIRKREPTWKVRKGSRGADYLIRSGVLYSSDKSRDPYVVAIGRPLAGNQKVTRQLTLVYALLIPIALFGSWLISGFALRPVAPERQV